MKTAVVLLLGMISFFVVQGAHATAWDVQCDACHPLMVNDVQTLEAALTTLNTESPVNVGDTVEVYKEYIPPSGNTVTIENTFQVLHVPVTNSNDISSIGAFSDVYDKVIPPKAIVIWATIGPDALYALCSTSTSCTFPMFVTYQTQSYLAPL